MPDITPVVVILNGQPVSSINPPLRYATPCLLMSTPVVSQSIAKPMVPVGALILAQPRYKLPIVRAIARR